MLETADLDAAEIHAWFGSALRHPEREDGRLLSFFTGRQSHVVLRAKELMVLRPHGHLLRTGGSLAPDESALTSTAWMGGVFHSMVTQGHVSINRFLSTCHSYLGLFRSHGQRVFMEIDGSWNLLGLPSAFEMSPDCCRWIYKHPAGLLEVVATAPADRHELRLELLVRAGAPARFLISHHVALNGDDGSTAGPAIYQPDGCSVLVRAIADSDVGRRFPEGGFIIEPAAATLIEKIGGDEMLFADGLSRDQPFLCLITAPATAAGLILRGALVAAPAEPAADWWDSRAADLRLTAPQASPLAPAAERAAEIFPWFIHASVFCRYLFWKDRVP